ncbi:MAG: L-threonylcarbamoyladenylate synthase [Parachlamydiaceae bacterium]
MHVSLSKAASLLDAGTVVAVPTETVYGLAARLDRPDAIAKIFTVKGRPKNNPLIVHIASAKDITGYVSELPPDLDLLAQAFWPGPLTLILPAIKESVPDIVRAGLHTVAIRVPDHPLTRELLKITGPLVMPSANPSGKPSATSSDHVEADFGKDFPVLDGGECHKGVESTILYWQDRVWTLARLGALAPEDFFSVLGYVPDVMLGMKSGENGAPLCPGQLYRHYAPKAHLTLTTAIPLESCDVILGFDDRYYPKGSRLLSLGSSLHPEEAARRLYAVLRQLDNEGIEHALVDVNTPDTGLWRTLRERLQKASKTQLNN